MRHCQISINTLLLVITLTACATQGVPILAPVTPASSPLPMPTRAPTPVALSVENYLERLHLELLQSGDSFVGAETAWRNALQLAPDNASVHREGARLALRQDTLEVAAERANTALRLNPQDAEAWMLAAVIAQRLGNLETAQEALRTAETLNPSLSPDLFPTQWQIAIETEDKEALGRLAQSYLVSHIDDPYAIYYRAEALLAADHARLALELLLLRMNTDSPGLLWYTLGRVYLALGDSRNAVIALETASAAFSRRDESLYLASADPARDISLALGRAYLDVRRCADALSLLQLLATPYPEAATMVDEANRCPVPAPTPTFAPWLP